MAMKRLSFLITIATILFGGCAKVNNSHVELNALPFFLGQNISCVCPDDSSKALYVGTENGTVHKFDTETGLFSKMDTSFEDVVYQIIISGEDTLFSIRNHGIIEVINGEQKPYTIKDKNTEYSAYSTLFPKQGDTFYAATSNGLFAYRKGHFDSADSLWRTCEIKADKNETDKQRFYSLWFTDGKLFAASESGLWFKDKDSTKAHIIDGRSCQFISPYNANHANVLFKDGKCYVLDAEKGKIDDTIQPTLYSESVRMLSRIREDESVEEGNIIGLGLGVLQAKDMDHPVKLPYVTQHRYENIKHFAAKIGDYLYIGNSFNLLRIPFYDKRALFKNGISIVSLCLDYKDTTSFYALTNEGRLYSLKSGEELQSTALGVLKGYKPGDELVGRLSGRLYVKSGGNLLSFGHDYKCPDTVQVKGSIKCVAPLNEQSLVIGTTDSVFVYLCSNRAEVDSLKVPQKDELKDDIYPQLIRVSGPAKNPKVFLHTLNHGSFLLENDKISEYPQLKDVRDLVFYDGVNSAYVLSKDGHVSLFNFNDGQVKDVQNFNTPIRRIASNLYQTIGIPDGFDIRGGAIGVIKDNNSTIHHTPDSFVYSLVILKDLSVVLGCDDYISVISYKDSGRGRRFDDFRMPRQFNWWLLIAVLLFLLLCMLLCFRIVRPSAPNRTVEPNSDEQSVLTYFDMLLMFLNNVDDRTALESNKKAITTLNKIGELIDEILEHGNEDDDSFFDDKNKAFNALAEEFYRSLGNDPYTNLIASSLYKNQQLNRRAKAFLVLPKLYNKGGLWVGSRLFVSQGAFDNLKSEILGWANDGRYCVLRTTDELEDDNAAKNSIMYLIAYSLRKYVTSDAMENWKKKA